MTWLTPVTGAILAAAVIPPLILLYFLKLRRRPQAIASTLLWKRSVEDLRANAPFQRLRRNLLLLLQLIALLLLVFAVMQPQIQAGRQRGGKTIFLIDNSASMTAMDAGEDETRLDEAKRLARERVEALYAGGLFSRVPGESMIVAFSDRAEVYCRFSRSKQELLDAIDRIRPTHGGTTLADALKLARAYTTNVDPESDRPVGAPATIEIFTDGRIADLPDQVLRGEHMIYYRIGTEEADNVTITAISVERPYDRPTAVEVFASLLNYNREAVTCDVQLSVDDTALAVEEIRIPLAEMDEGSGQLLPGRNNVVFTPFEQPRGAVLEIANLRDDALLADNVAQIVVPPPKRLIVGLVPASSFFVREALEGLSLKRLELLTQEQYEQRAEENRLDQYDVIVFDDYAPPPGLMPPGRYLSFGRTPPVDGLNEFGEHGAQLVLNIREEHPALRFVNLDNLRIGGGHLLQPAPDVEVLAEGSQGPLLVAVSRGAMHLIHVTFDPGMSTWPLLRSWVTFIFNAVEYLGQVGQGLTAKDLAVGEAIATRLPSSATDIALAVPESGIVPLEPRDPSQLSWGPIRLAGLYVLSWEVPDQDETQTRAFAVNLLDEFEGRIDVVPELQVGQTEVAGRAGESGVYTPLWPWAVALCLLVLMLEWWVYHRKMWV
ncbi:MAG: VWA domain-containing protein [Planctomycetes bacterium]|nr:VWA domain-containing protein [Planctomycetota bacterium]